MVPTINRMGATMMPNSRPENDPRTGAFSAGEAGSVRCSWAASVPQCGQNLQGDTSCSPHF